MIGPKRFHAGRTQTYILVKMEKNQEILYELLEKCVFTKVAINGKILAMWPNYFDIRGGYLGTSLHIITNLFDE